MSPLYSVLFSSAVTLGLLVCLLVGQRLAGTRRAVTPAPAAGVLQAGNVVGVAVMAPALVLGCADGQSLAHDVEWTAAFGVAAVAVFAATSHLGGRVLLGARVKSELARGNLAAAVAAAGHSLATAIVVARSLTGASAHELAVALVFFVVAQLTLNGLVLLFRRLTAYDDAEEIVDGNVAAAVSYAGATVAVALLVGRAVEGTFRGWGPSLWAFGLALGDAVVLYPVRQVLVQGLLLGAHPSFAAGRLDQLVGRERNVGVAAMEAAAYVGTAFVLERVL